MSDRQKLFFALLASAFLHILIFYVLARWPTKHANDVLAAPKRDLSQLTVTIMPPKAAAPQAPVPALAAAAASPTPLPVLDSDGLKKSAKAPEHALFQSDANMVAGSLLPGTGDIPVPSEAGPRRNFKEFANQPASMGKGEAPSQPRPMHHARPAPQPPAMPVQTPYAVTQVRRAATPPPTPVPTPTPSADNIALGHQTPTPEPAAQLPTPIAELARLAPRAPSLRAQADMAPMEPPEPEAPPEPASPEGSMQKRTDRTRIDGGITAVGPDGVDAVETPFGRYHRKLSKPDRLPVAALPPGAPEGCG